MTYIAVIGAAACDGESEKAAEEVGRLLARAGAVLVCGGRGGVMEASCRGARMEGGLTVGILPGMDREEGNVFLSLALPTGLGNARNAVLAAAADAAIAVSGGYGTLSEIGHFLKLGKLVVGVKTWGGIRGMQVFEDPQEAVSSLLDRIDRSGVKRLEGC